MSNSKSLHDLLVEVKARIHVAGFRSASTPDAKIVMEALKAFSNNGSFQLMNADLIAGPKHIQFAAANALKAFEDGYNMSRTLPTEILRYASTRRQIKNAIELLGISKLTPRIVAVLIDFTNRDKDKFADQVRRICHGVLNDNVIEIASKTKLNRLTRVYGITEQEINSHRHFAPTDQDAVINAIVERMAILSIEK